MTLNINIPSVVAEIETVFSQYEAALIANDVQALDGFFFKSPMTVRYGVDENLHSYEEIAAFRAARSPGGLARTLERTLITTYGHDMATVWTLFHRDTMKGKVGRQSQVWMRTGDGWQVVAAHVSVIAAAD